MSENERGEKTEYVYSLLKEMIFGWKLEPGQKVNISSMARHFNVSAIPLREALSRLHSEKLVIFEPNKGYRVSEILTPVQMRELSEARLLLELRAVLNIIRLNTNTFGVADQLQQLNDAMKQVNTASSYKEILDFVHYDQQFHGTLMKAGGNAFLVEAYNGLHCHLHIARFYHVRGYVDQKDATDEHHEIIESIKTRDIYRAEEAISNHIRFVTKRLLQNDEPERFFSAGLRGLV